MSYADIFNQIGLGISPATVSDGDATRWFDAGSELMGGLLDRVGLRRRFDTRDLSDAARRGLVEAIIDAGLSSLRRAGTALVDGASTVASWFATMKAGLMPRLYAGTMAMAQTIDLAPVDRDGVADAATVQIGFLTRFRREIESGDQPLSGVVPARSAGYANSIWSVAMNLHAASKLRDGYSEERRVMGGAERHCVVCPELAARGFVKIGTLPKIGDSPCGPGCRCWFTYR